MSEDFLQAYENHIWDVYGYFAYRGVGRADAEDLTQATFERALKAWDGYDAEIASAKTWLLAIAHNAYVDFRRRDRSARTPSLSSDEVAEGELPSISGPEPPTELDPTLTAAIGRLSRREREAIALRFGADMRGPEIAEFLDVSLANAQQLLSRGLRKVRREIDRRERTTSGARKKPAAKKSPARTKSAAKKKQPRSKAK
jgi:RNA polymerase sigma-70 factor, ECF subfamily